MARQTSPWDTALCQRQGSAPRRLIGDDPYATSNCSVRKAVDRLPKSSSGSVSADLNRRIVISQSAGNRPALRMTAEAPAGRHIPQPIPATALPSPPDGSC